MVCHSDFDHFPMGGITTYCKNLIGILPKYFDLKLVGLTTSDKYEIGKWHRLDGPLGGKPIEFLPIMKITFEEFENRKIPLKVQFAYQLLMNLSKLREMDPCTYLTHDIELTVPLFLLHPRPDVYTIRHGIGEFVNQEHGQKYFKNPIIAKAYLALEDWILRRVRGTIVVSQDGFDYYTQKYPTRKSAFKLVASGVDTGFFHEIIELKPLDGRNPVVFTACRLEPEKGLDLLIHAFKELLTIRPDARMVIAGSGSQEQNLRNLTGSLGLDDNIDFVGALTRSELLIQYNKSSVFAVTSEWEGMPLAVLEALACGLPVVSTDVGYINTAVHPGETGYLCPDRDPVHFAQILANVISDPGVFRMNSLKVAQEHSLVTMGTEIRNFIIQ